MAKKTTEEIYYLLIKLFVAIETKTGSQYVVKHFDYAFY